MPIDFSGSRIYTDNNTKNLVIKLGISGEAIELSSNRTKINNDIEILGNIINVEFNNLKQNVSTITQNINIGGVSFESLNTDYATLSDLSNINNIINNLDQSFVLLSEFIELSQNFYALDASLSDYALDASLSAYALDASLSALSNIFDASLSALSNTFDASLTTLSNTFDASLSALSNTLDASLSAYALDASLSAYALDASLSAYALDASLSAYALDASLSAYALDASLNASLTAFSSALDASLTAFSSALDASLSAYALDASLSAYALDASLNAASLNALMVLDASLTAFSSAFDASLTILQNQINTISGNFITREELDASFQNINISGNFVNEASFNDLQNKSDNFFFFFKLKPWSLVYNNGNYSYPISNYGNSFTYNLGDFSNSHKNNFSSSSSNLQLFWKIPPRIFINSTLNNTNINFLPIYDNLIIEFREQTSNIWKQLVNLSNFPDPSNNSGYTGYNNKNDLSMIFILDLTRNTANANDNYTISIIDLSFEINYSGGYTNFQNSEGYQFRIYLNNSSDISNNFDKKNDQYNYEYISNNYLYFPDTSNVYFLTASRGLPKSPTNITFSNVDFDSVLIGVTLNDTTADVNNIISIPIPSDDNNNKLIFILDLVATKNSNYKKYIPYSINSYIIDDISNNNNPSTILNFNLLTLQTLEPEFTYDLSNYGMYFINDVSNISYASINQNFTTRAPKRNEVSSDFNLYISNTSLFDTNLINYNADLDFLNIIWRETNETIMFYFFDDSNSLFNINSNNINEKIFNSLKTLDFNNINQINEPKGIDLSNNLCSFILYSQKISNSGSNISNIYNSFIIDSSFNNFLTTTINNSNNKYTFNYTSQDILPYSANSINDYSKKNGYYIGLVLNDICYNIDLNDFFDTTNDLSVNNIKLKTKITQEFNNISYNKEQEYLIYKITDDLSQNITLDSSSSIFNLTYNENNQGTYFGLTSIKPHNTIIDLSFNGLLNNLSKYIRPTNNILATLNLKVTGSSSSSNSTNINWESNNSSTININASYIYYPLTNLNSTYGTYEGIYDFNGLLDLTINNNIFSQNSTLNYNNLVLGNVIDVSNKYFWNLGTLASLNNNNNNYFNDTSMIVFNNNPLNNIDHNSAGGTFYNPYSSNSYIKYNQALYQKQSSHTFYSGNNNIFYKNYSIYQGNNNSNLDYSIFDTSGDLINYTINIPYWFYNNSINKEINNIYKWVCFDINLSTLSITSDNITLDLRNININTIGTNYLFYIKLKYNGNLQINGQNIIYSKWFDCLSVLNTGLSDSQRVTTNKSGIYNNNITAGTYPLDLILPYLSSYANNLILLVGLYDLDLNINDLYISFT
jgi:hypothetical protein